MAHSRTVTDVSPRALSIPVKLLHAVSGDDTIPTGHETISPDGEDSRKYRLGNNSAGTTQGDAP
jgi:hypothetical protein